MPTGTPGNNDIHIKYNISNSRTLESRFDNARSSGESCTWTVTYQGTTTELTGTYYFSNGMGAGVPWVGSGSKFSADDGAWGAGSGMVDGIAGGPLGREAPRRITGGMRIGMVLTLLAPQCILEVALLLPKAPTKLVMLPQMRQRFSAHKLLIISSAGKAGNDLISSSERRDCKYVG